MDPQTASVSEVNRHVRLSLAVFATLLALTGVTVAVAYVDLGHGANVAAALTIATVKASLVGLFFMHLKWEQRKVHGLLLLTFFLINSRNWLLT